MIVLDEFQTKLIIFQFENASSICNPLPIDCALYALTVVLSAIKSVHNEIFRNCILFDNSI